MSVARVDDEGDDGSAENGAEDGAETGHGPGQEGTPVRWLVVGGHVVSGVRHRVGPARKHILPARGRLSIGGWRASLRLIGMRRKRLADRVQDAALGLGQGGWQGCTGGEAMAAASEL